LKVADREWAMAALAAYEVELVMVFRPPFLANFQPLMTLEQQLVVVMARNHPLAGQRKLRLSDCAAYPVALPERSIGGRQLLEEFSARTGLRFKVAAESNSFEMLRALVVHAGLISFQIQIGTMAAGNKLGVVAREIDGRDVPRANLVFGHLRERALPVATAVFAETIRRKLEAMRAAGATSDVRKPARAASRSAMRSISISSGWIAPARSSASCPTRPSGWAAGSSCGSSCAASMRCAGWSPAMSASASCRRPPPRAPRRARRSTASSSRTAGRSAT